VKVRLLALDFDGTIAVDGRLDGEVADAIRDARQADVMTVLVSERMLADVQALLPAPDLFDAIVAEGGAVVQMSNGASPNVLARGPDAALLAEIRHPTGADRIRDDARERGVREEQPPSRRHPVGLVVEAFGEHLGQVLDGRGAQ
jgi:hypothetical protein